MSFGNTSIFTTNDFIEPEKSEINFEIVQFLSQFFILSDVF